MTNAMPAHPLKRSVALLIRESGAGERILTVRRPDDDEDLPGLWGLPAASLARDEAWEDAVRRAAREKLGVDVEPLGVLNAGTKARPGYTLAMRLYAARLLAGEPDVGQPADGTTRYAAWRWADAEALRPAAERGSLCARLALEVAGGG